MLLIAIVVATAIITLRLRHSWHGSFEDRKYVQRWDVLSHHNFMPSVHMVERQDGLVTWAADAPEQLKSMTLQYFRSTFCSMERSRLYYII
jgi:hypothetical protein